MESYPRETFFGDNVYALSQVRADTPLNMSLAEALRAEDWIQEVSPEVIAFTLLGGEPVIIRGVEPSEFLALEDGSIVSGEAGENFALAGDRLVRRFDLGVGDRVALVGSTTPVLFETTVSGVFTTPGPSSDELLLPLHQARRLAGLAEDHILVIRVVAADEDRLKAFLETTEVPVLMGTGRQDPLALNSNETLGPNILRLAIMSPELATKIDRSFISTFAQQGINSVTVVVWGFIALTLSLTFIGVASTLARALFEKRRDVGILSALGANRMRIRGFLAVELAQITAVAAVVGSAVGFALSASIGSLRLVVLFGHVLEPELTPISMVWIALATGLGSFVLGMLINEFSLRWRPTELIREAEGPEEEVLTLQEVLRS
jgi:ABC-type lipoprotein release transport system permease subunit